MTNIAADILKLKYDSKTIADCRSKIAEALKSRSANIKDSMISKISANDLKLLFDLYDGVFLQNWFQSAYKGKMKFSLSGRMTKSAGKTLCPKNIADIKPEDLTIEIRIGADFFLQYDMIEKNKAVCGIRTSNSLEALMLVFEHEICHVIEFVLFHESNCSRERFKTIANNLFGHTESCHKLPTQKEIAKRKLGLEIGNTVSFTFENQTLTGILYNISKRATVMVRDSRGSLADKNGRRYTKYYVPLALLKHIKQHS